MNRVRSVSIDSLARRSGTLIVLIGTYGTAVGFVMLLAGDAREPGWMDIAVLQLLMLPVPFVAYSLTHRGDTHVVPLVAVTPALGVILLYLQGPSLRSSVPPWLDVLVTIVVLAMPMLAVSGSWAIVGYVAGIAIKWRRRDVISERRPVESCYWAVLGSVFVIALYLATLAVWVFGVGDLV